jgi:serine protease DegS
LTSCRLSHGPDVPSSKFHLAEKVLASTVKIKHDGGGHGTGFFCFEHDLVCTAAHVVEPGEDYTKISIQKYQGGSCSIMSVLYPAQGDYAILRVDCSGSPLTTAIKPQTGDEVMAVGNPFDVAWAVTFGHVVSEEHKVFGLDMFVFSAPVNPGNSGGPIVDMHGCLVGIVNAIRTRDGMWAGLGFGTRAEYLEELLRG